MSDLTEPAASAVRLQALLTLLVSDPHNLTLLADAAQTALSALQPDLALELLERYAAIQPLPAVERNLAGLAELQTRRYGDAVRTFERLLKACPEDEAVRFNLAWAYAMSKEIDRALEMVDLGLARALPQAAMLQVQLLHERGELDEAHVRAKEYVQLHPSYAPLAAAVSVLAVDLEDVELAAACAAKGGDHPDALSTLGTLAIGDDRPGDAIHLFNRALEQTQKAPRAWVGRGLARLLTGETHEARADLDRGAEMFGDHLGSWIAAGWAHYIHKDIPAARARFERALELDHNFAETHGSLAVLDLVEGDTESARVRIEIALRLDRQCYSGALASSMLAAAEGEETKARRIYETALDTPVDGIGRTIRQALARVGRNLHRE